MKSGSFSLSLVCSALLLLPCLTTRTAAQAGEGETASAVYEDAVKTGIEEYQLGNFAEAYAAMKRAHSVSPNARTLRGMGVAAYALKRYPEALRCLRAALVDTRKPLNAEQRKEAEAFIQRADAFVGRVTLALSPEDATLSVDNEPAIFEDDGTLVLAIGRRELVVRSEGYAPATRVLNLVGGERLELRVTLEPEKAVSSESPHSTASTAPASATSSTAQDSDAGATQRLIAYVTLGVGGALAVTTAVAIGVRQSAVNRYNSNACAPTPSQRCPGDAARASDMETLAIVTGVGAGAALITGVVLLLTAPSAREDEPVSALLPCALGVGARAASVQCKLAL